jgi:hypothetical protein
MRYLFLSLLLTLAACAGLGLTQEQAQPIVDEALAVVGPPLAEVFAKHNVPPEVGAQFLAAMKDALSGLLTSGPDWLSILGTAADAIVGLVVFWFTGKRTGGFGLSRLLKRKAATP